jgi:SpoVK/Ycf46/Vps4 family AAA+-type ATPase
MDECAGVVTDGEGSTHNGQERMLNAFLTQIEGIQNSQGPSDCKFLFIGNTNKPWDVATGMLSRFRGNLIYMGLPDEQERLGILRLKLGKVPLDPNVDFSEIARRTELYSGRDLDAICSRVKTAAMDRNLTDPSFDAIPQEMLLGALSEISPAVVPEHLRRLKEWSISHGIKISDPAV